jgi:tetratricopeptide (TPR) repeat protein
MKRFLKSIPKTPRPIAGQLVLLCALSGLALAQSSANAAAEVQRLAQVAQVAQQEGRYEDALHAYQTITVITANYPKIAAPAYLNIGNIYMTLKNFDEAAKAFQSSISLDAGSAEAYNGLGEALGELKRYPQAIEAFQQAVAIDQNSLKARSNMGVTYARMGQPKYAEFVYRMLVRDHPGYAVGYDGLAVTISKSGRVREAIQLQEKAISLSPEVPSFHYNLGVNYLILGNPAKAREQQQKLRELNSPMADKLANLIAMHGK